MLVKLAQRSAEFIRRTLPDPFVFAVLLTVITGIAAVLWVGAGPLEVLSGWYDGFWMLLEFGMQIILILVTGYAIALSAPAARLIDRLALKITRPASVYLTVLVAGELLNLVSWGWIVLAAVLGRELAIRVRGVHYPYLLACVFVSSGSWVTGFSSSIPLMLNTPDNFLIESGLLSATIPVSTTLGSPLNLTVIALYVVGGPLVMWLLRPRGAAIEIDDLRTVPGPAKEWTVAEEAEALRDPEPILSDKLNHSAVLQMFVVAMGLAYIVTHFIRRGFDLNLNLMIFIFLIFGMLLHRTPIAYVTAMARACSNISGIVFQYPFYAGIMGIMMATGLGTAIAEWMTSYVTLKTLPLAAFLLGGAVNFSIPSAGGEWAVIGPPLIETARDLAGQLSAAEFNSLVGRIAMATAYGESLTNLLQPFFLLTILPVMGAGVRVQAREVVGYFLLPFLIFFAIVGVLVSAFPL
ncbi:MAG: TIGR00366 family protein [Acidobacteriota bacterium]